MTRHQAYLDVLHDFFAARLDRVRRRLEVELLNNLAFVFGDRALCIAVDPDTDEIVVRAELAAALRGFDEIDLVQEGAPGNRFGETEEQRRAFSTAYGYDLAGWFGWRPLRDLRDLHSLAAYIRTAPTKPAARAVSCGC